MTDEERLARKRERNRKWMKRWRDANREEARARDRERYGAKRREQARLSTQRWRDRHPEKSKAKSLQNKWANIERARERGRAYQKSHRAEYAEAQRRRIARLKGADVGNVTMEALEQLLIAQRSLCVYCGRRLRDDKHLDHKTPLARGGAHDVGNLAWACRFCNQQKQTMTAEEYQERISAATLVVQTYGCRGQPGGR